MKKIKKMSDWYFEGYEIKKVTKNGKTKNVYGEYKGKYYSLGMDSGKLKAFKVLHFALCVFFLAVYFFTSLWPSKANSTWPGMFNLLIIIPILYLIIGSGYFLRAKLEMTVRNVYSSVNAIVKSLYAILILSGVTVISDIIYASGSQGSVFGENTVFFAGTIGYTAIATYLHTMWKKHPCEEIKA